MVGEKISEKNTKTGVKTMLDCLFHGPKNAHSLPCKLFAYASVGEELKCSEEETDASSCP